MRLSLFEIMAATGARPLGAHDGSLILARVSMDSRAARPGDLFLCLKGERVDGHDFAAQAVARGAGAVLAERAIPGLPPSVPVLLAADARLALTRLAAFWREKAGAKVAAVTGTAGKTTVKEMIAAILAVSTDVAKTRGNLNNQIGLPLSMLEASDESRVWVMELGISRPGDMEELAALAAPDLAVITNIGPAHLEGLGGIAGVAKAKAALIGFVRAGGRALVSADYPELTREAACYGVPCDTFSTQDEGARFFAAYLGANCTGGRFRLVIDGNELALTIPLFGVHAAENLAAAAGAAILLGADPKDIAPGLAALEVPGGRFACRAEGELLFIDDTYNANPLSMARSIRAAAERAEGMPLVLVLGAMGELGEEARQRHHELGAVIAASGSAAVYFQGGQAAELACGLAEAGFTGRFEQVDGPETFAGRFAALGLTRGVVLFKGSRAQGMERYLAEALAVARGERP